MKRRSSLGTNPQAIDREIGNTAYDNILEIKDNIELLEAIGTQVIPEVDNILNANTNATNAATSAAASATTASNAATTTTNNLNEFKSSYYGPLASNPTLDPFGNPLDTGDVYFNTTEQVLRIYTVAGWATFGTNVQGLITDETQTATADQSLFTGLSYDIGYVVAYRNGTRLVKDVDFTANDGTTLTLTTPANAGDVITVEAIGAFNNGQLSTILADIAQLQTDVAVQQLMLQITTNTISTNTSNISTNTTNIATNTSDISTINSNAAFKNQSNVFTNNQRIDGNLGINTLDYGSGTNVIGILNSSSVPTTNPTNGVVIYSESDILKYRDTNGSVFSLGDSVPNFSYNRVVVPLTVSSNQQMSIVGELYIDSVLTIDGELAFLN
jgi:hypothetical protein